jgi:hypothetical protein
MGLLHAVKSYDMGPPALLPIREEGGLRIFSPLKIHRLGLVLNPQPLGLVASTLTTTPPRRAMNFLVYKMSLSLILQATP